MRLWTERAIGVWESDLADVRKATEKLALCAGGACNPTDSWRHKLDPPDAAADPITKQEALKWLHSNIRERGIDEFTAETKKAHYYLLSIDRCALVWVICLAPRSLGRFWNPRSSI